MPTLEEIQDQIEALDLDSDIDLYNTKKEIRYLPEILSNDESVLAITQGFMDVNTWLIVCTEKRVIFLDRGMLYGLKQIETPLEQINSIGQQTGVFVGSIGIWDGSSRMEITMVAKQTVRPFVEAVNRARDALKANDQRSKNDTPQPCDDVATQLERLASLRDRGVLTDSEFQEQKARILAM